MSTSTTSSTSSNTRRSLRSLRNRSAGSQTTRGIRNHVAYTNHLAGAKTRPKFGVRGTFNSVLTPAIESAANRAVAVFFGTVFGNPLGEQLETRNYANDLRSDLVRLFGDYTPAVLADEFDRVNDDNAAFEMVYGGDYDKPELGPDPEGYYDPQFGDDDDDDEDDSEYDDDDESESENVKPTTKSRKNNKTSTTSTASSTEGNAAAAAAAACGLD